MGAEAEMAMDGGRKLIPSSTAAVEKNINGITHTLRDHDADVFLLQELTRGSILSRWYNVEKRVREALKNHDATFAANFAFPLPIQWMRSEHGIGTYVREPFRVMRTESHAFSVSEVYYGCVKRSDRFLVTYIHTPDNAHIAIINTHLSSFDAGGAIRLQQCKELLAHAHTLYTRGYRTLIGADWNLLLQDAFLTDAEKDRYTKLLKAFPHEELKDGWSVHYCPNTPTVRAASAPYHRDTTTQASIDGFVCSPGIRVVRTTALDYDFQHADHNPVELVVEL